MAGVTPAGLARDPHPPRRRQQPDAKTYRPDTGRRVDRDGLLSLDRRRTARAPRRPGSCEAVIDALQGGDVARDKLSGSPCSPPPASSQRKRCGQACFIRPVRSHIRASAAAIRVGNPGARTGDGGLVCVIPVAHPRVDAATFDEAVRSSACLFGRFRRPATGGPGRPRDFGPEGATRTFPARFFNRFPKDHDR